MALLTNKKLSLMSVGWKWLMGKPNARQVYYSIHILMRKASCASNHDFTKTNRLLLWSGKINHGQSVLGYIKINWPFPDCSHATREFKIKTKLACLPFKTTIYCTSALLLSHAISNFTVNYLKDGTILVWIISLGNHWKKQLSYQVRSFQWMIHN